MKKLLMAIAGAVAIAFTAGAANENWFDGGIASGFPTAGSLSGGAWANTTDQAEWDATAEAVVITADTPVEFAMTDTKTLGADAKVLTFNSSIVFTPFDDATKITNIVDAKAGVAVVSNANEYVYYVLAKDDTTNKWTATSIAGPTPDTEVDVSIVVTNGANGGSAVYTFGDKSFGPVDIVLAGSSEAFSKVALVGDCEMTALTGLYDSTATLKIPADQSAYASVVVSNETAGAVVEKTGDGYNFNVGDAAAVYYYAKPGYLFTDGSSVKKYTGTMNKDIDLSAKTPDVPEKAEAVVNGSVYYLSFVDGALKAAQDGDVVTLCKEVTLTAALTIDKAITLNLAKNTINLPPMPTSGWIQAITLTKDGSVVSNGTIKSSATANYEQAMALVASHADVLLKDLDVDAAHYGYGVLANCDVLGGYDAIYAQTSLKTLTLENVDVTGNGTLFELEGMNVSLDADCSATKDGNTPFKYMAAIYCAGNARTTIAGGTYSFEGGNALLTGALPGQITVNDGTFTGAIASYMTDDDTTSMSYPQYGNAVVTINNGDFTGLFTEYWCESTNIVWATKGGTFSVKPADRYIASGYWAKETAGGKYQVVAKGGFAIILAGATEPSNWFDTLADANAAAANGDTIKFLANASIDARVEVTKAITFDLNGFTLTRTNGLDSQNTYSGNGSVLDFRAGAGSVVVKNGTIDCSALTQTVGQSTTFPTGSQTPFCECDAITVRSGAYLTMSDMTIIVNNITGCCAYPFNGGTIAITSGTYKNLTTEAYPFKAGFKALVLNQFNAQPKSIQLSGGTYYGQDPATGDDSAKVESFLADGYYSLTVSEGVHQVVNTGLAAAIGAKGYATLAGAVAALQEDDTLKLLADVTASADMKFETAFEFDLNGKTFTVNAGTTLDVSASITFSNSVAGQGGFCNNGIIKANEDMDLSSFAWAAGGFLPGTTSANFQIAANKTVNFGAGTTMKGMLDFNANFFNGSAATAQVVAGGKTYTCTADGFGYWEGTGTLADPYLITSVSDLLDFKQVVKDQKFMTSCFKQTVDLDLAGIEWDCIGVNNGTTSPGEKGTYEAQYFHGTYDGGNKAITNLKFANAQYIGFFGGLWSAGVSNLTITTVGIVETGSVAAYSINTLVGFARNSVIQNVTINGDITCKYNSAGFVGKAQNTTFIDCTNNVNIVSTEKRVAGFVGYESSLLGSLTFIRCVNNGNLESLLNDSNDYGVGGFIGGLSASSVIFTDCEANGLARTYTMDGENKVYSTTRCGSFVGCVKKDNATSIAATGCSANAEQVAVGPIIANKDVACTISGLQFATFAGDPDEVATFVAAPVVNDGVTYHVMAPLAEFNFTTEGTIKLDETLATATVTADDAFAVSGPVEGVYTATKKPAKIGSVYYLTLLEAINAVKTGETIELCCDTTAPGVVINKPDVTFTIDLKKYTYSVNKPGAGSAGTETSAFQVLAGNVTFKDGTIKASDDNLVLATVGKNIKRFFQVYSDLTLQDVSIQCANLYVNDGNVNRAAIEVVDGDVALTGSTSIDSKAEGNVIALNVDTWTGHTVNGAAVEINTTGTIDGILCYTEENPTLTAALTLTAGTITKIAYGSEADAETYTVTKTGATVTTIPTGYVWTSAGVLVKSVIQIDDKWYATYGDALVAAKDNDTVKLTDDYTITDAEQDQLVITGKVVTLDFGGNTLTVPGTMVSDQKFVFAAGSTVTLTNGTLDTGTASSRGLNVYGTLNIYCAVNAAGSNRAIFDVYGATINVYDGAVLTSTASAGQGIESFRFKDEDLTSTVHVYGGTISGANTRMFSNYKSGHKAIITLDNCELSMSSANSYFFGCGNEGDKCVESWDVTFGQNAKFNSANIVEKGTAAKGKIFAKGYGAVAIPETAWYKVDKLTYTIAVTGGSSSPDSYQISDEAQVATLTAAAAETGKSFEQWNLTELEGVSIADITLSTAELTIAQNTTGNVAVAAQYTNNVYYVTFYTNEVEAAKAYYTYGDETLVYPEVPGVSAWSNSTYTAEFVFDGNQANNDQAAYAKIATSEGPQPGSGSSTDVQPAKDPSTGETIKDSYVITPTAGNNTVVVEGVKSTDTLIITNASIMTLGCDAQPKEVKVLTPNGTSTPYDITGACKGFTGNTFDASLDGDKYVDVGGESIKVQPTAIEADSTEGTIADGAIATKSIPGLTYKLVRDDTAPSGSFETQADSELATSATVTLKDETSSKPTTKAFYKIIVTK